MKAEIIEKDISFTSVKKRWYDNEFKPEVEVIDPSNPFYEKYICFTGKLENMTRAEAAQLVVNLGGILEKGVTKKTNYLVTGDYVGYKEDFTSSKMKKAKLLMLSDQNLQILSNTVFFDMLSQYLEDENK